jgi:hypothetical protein
VSVKDASIFRDKNRRHIGKSQSKRTRGPIARGVDPCLFLLTAPASRSDRACPSPAGRAVAPPPAHPSPPAPSPPWRGLCARVHTRRLLRLYITLLYTRANGGCFGAAARPGSRDPRREGVHQDTSFGSKQGKQTRCSVRPCASHGSSRAPDGANRPAPPPGPRATDQPPSLPLN